MASPVAVRTHTNDATTLVSPLIMVTSGNSAQALPPISSYAFADILRSADGPNFQHAIDGIAEICARTRLSLADEYGSHLPPLGEITAASSAATRPHVLRPGMRRALTVVPEGSSGSSEGSRKSKRSSRAAGLFGFGKKEEAAVSPMRSIRIDGTGRTIPVSGTTALGSSFDFPDSSHQRYRPDGVDASDPRIGPASARPTSEAETSLQRLLAQTPSVEATNA